MDVWVAEERVRLARSQAVRRRRTARGFAERSKVIVSTAHVDQRKRGHTFLVFTLEFLDKVVDETIIKIFSAKMGITSGGLDFENTLLNSEERDVESSSTEIEDEDVAFAGNLLVETIGDSGRSGFIDDSENVHPRDGASIFCGLPLRVVEVGGDGNDRVINGGSEVRFSGFLHLEEDHRRDFFRRLETEKKKN